MFDSVNTTVLLPSLVVKAPEFPSGDDKEECHGLGIMNSTNDKRRQAMSIDDALASALAGFISSDSVQSQKYTQALTVKAPEFSNEDVHEDKCASPRIQRKLSGQDCIGEKGCEDMGLKVTVVDKDENGDVRCGISNNLFAHRSDIPNQLLQNQTDDSSDISPGVDFDIPLMDVKFISQKDDHSKPSIESLFGDMPETKVLTPPGNENDDYLTISKQYNLTSVDDEEPVNLASNSHVSLDLDYCKLIDVLVNFEEENLPEYHLNNSHEMLTSSLI
ncbi:Exosome complex component Rrp41 like [Quillaja saponaria]|uniref:Exosome complex component Rrp41 like n=1 Tax=Quillaja saponaria TaxID=32244 RepID=A0AAD7QIN0_QUISA|nr:Exosome complex component Rrp41 like [Quillaja saponaria]